MDEETRGVFLGGAVGSGGDGAEGSNETLEVAIEEGARVEDEGVVDDAGEDRGL